MAKFKRGRTSDASDDEMEEQYVDAPKVKKAKSSKMSTASTAGSRNEKGEPYWELTSSNRRVTVTKFGYGKSQNVTRVDIREFYEKDGEHLPGRKGISLSVEQFSALLRAVPSIKAALIKEGASVEDVGAEAIVGEDNEKSRVSDPSRPIKHKPSKSNIEATSDEDEE